MKKILFVAMVLFCACQKQNPQQNQNLLCSKNDEKKLTIEQMAFIAELQTRIRNVGERDIDPNNPNNPFDGAGIYFQSMVQSIFDQEQIATSNSIQEINVKFTNYAEAHPFNFFQAQAMNGLFDLEVLALLRATTSSNNSLSISQLKTIEDAIVGSSLFESNSRSLLLSYSATSKFWLDSQTRFVTMFTDIIDTPIPEGWWDCVEAAYAYNLGSALTDTDNIVSTILAWEGLPITMVIAASSAMQNC